MNYDHCSVIKLYIKLFNSIRSLKHTCTFFLKTISLPPIRQKCLSDLLDKWKCVTSHQDTNMKGFVAAIVVLLFVETFLSFPEKISGLGMPWPEAALQVWTVALLMWEDVAASQNILRSYASTFYILYIPGDPVSSGLSLVFSLLSQEVKRTRK